jgi:polysaccharide biosynthesis/export protein
MKWIHQARILGSIFLLLALLGRCSHSPGYIWAGQYPDSRDPPEYVLAPGDLIFVRVFNQDNMSARTRVRADGKVSLPFLNDVTAVGLTPNELAQQVQVRLKHFINTPVVTVSLEESRSLSVTVLGEVTKPGVYTLAPEAGVLSAIASAGGLTDYASKDRIFVLRQDPKPARIRFSYDGLSQPSGKEARFKLHGGDVVTVE